MGSCIGKCWCNCCDCCLMAAATARHHRRSAPISDMSSSTSMLFDSMHNLSPARNNRCSGSRRRSDSTVACIARSWSRRKSFATQVTTATTGFCKRGTTMDVPQPGLQLHSNNNNNNSHHALRSSFTRHPRASPRHQVNSTDFVDQPLRSTDTFMCDFDIPEPTELQVRETRAGSILSTASQDSPDDRRRRRRRSGTGHQVVAFNRQAMDERVEFSVPRKNRTSASGSQHQQKDDGTSRVDQSFPLLDPLLSYTHETYLGTPTTDYLSTICPGVRLAGGSPCGSVSVTENAVPGGGGGGGDGGSLDGFEWDNYDETQIKPENDDEDDVWLSVVRTAGAGIAESGIVVEDDESFAEVFKHRDSRAK